MFEDERNEWQNMRSSYHRVKVTDYLDAYHPLQASMLQHNNLLN